MQLTREYLNWLFHYDRENGKLYWKNHWYLSTKMRVKGKEVGTIDKGYLRVKIGYETYQVHRLIFCLEYGYFSDYQIDHINGNSLENHFLNLRELSVRGNQQNRAYHRQGKLVGATFVKDKNKWMSQASLDHKHIFIGYYDTELEAHVNYLNYVLNNNLSSRKTITKDNGRKNIRQHIKKYRGVSIYKNKFRARLKIKGVEYHLGYFETEIEAHQRYMQELENRGLA